jgi:hypothetical protein
LSFLCIKINFCVIISCFRKFSFHR